MAVTGLGSTTYYAARKVVERLGPDPDKDVRFLSVGDIWPALAGRGGGGRVDPSSVYYYGPENGHGAHGLCRRCYSDSDVRARYFGKTDP